LAFGTPDRLIIYMKTLRSHASTYLFALMFLFSTGLFQCGTIIDTIGSVASSDSSDNDSSDDGNGDGNQDGSFDLAAELGTVGNMVQLPSNLTQYTIAEVIDQDDDGVGDGLNLDNNVSEPEIFYNLSSPKNKATRNGTTVQFEFRYLSGNTYYFYVENDALAFAENSDLTSSFQLYFDDGTNEIQGLDFNKNGSMEPEDFWHNLGQTVYRNGQPTALFTSVPGYRHWPGSSLTFTVGGSTITEFDYEILRYNGGSEISETDGSGVTGDSFGYTFSIPDNYEIRIIGKDADGNTQSESTNYYIEVRYFYHIHVYNADQVNENKSSPSQAQELWIMTTRAETGGYESERVRLYQHGDSPGDWSGTINVLDDSELTFIIWDDVQTLQHYTWGSFNGSFTNMFNELLTDDYFSPCFGMTLDGQPYQNFLDFTPTNTSIQAPLMPRLESVSYNAYPTETNDEVFYSVSSTAFSGTQPFYDLSYLDLNKGTTSELCNCSQGMRIITGPSVTPNNVTAGDPSGFYLTDDDPISASGACVVRGSGGP
jgi:hypothetical protein